MMLAKYISLEPYWQKMLATATLASLTMIAWALWQCKNEQNYIV
jgi:hypothetical protein